MTRPRPAPHGPVCHTQDPHLAHLAHQAAAPQHITIISNYPPHKADAVITTEPLSTELERYASTMTATVVVLPEGTNYLTTKLANGTWTVLCGSDMQHTPPEPTHTKQGP